MRALAVLTCGVLCSPLAAQSRALPAWQIEATPLLRIGQEGDPAREFLRVAGVVRLPSGGIVVANAGTQELRLFSPTGAFMKAFSRKGDGPGELQALASLTRHGDTLVVTERGFGPARIHYYRLDGSFLSRVLVRPPNAPRGVLIRSVGRTGELLVSPGGVVPTVPPPEGTVRRDSIEIGVLAHPEAAVRWLGWFPNIPWLSYELAAGPVRRTMAAHPLGPSIVLGVDGGQLWIGDSGTGRLLRVGVDGALGDAIHAPFAPRGFDERALQVSRDRELAEAPNADARSRIESAYAQSVRPATVPRFTKLLAGPGNELWIHGFVEDARSPRPVIVLGSAGAPVARVELPGGLTVWEVGRDYVVGVSRDADGVETVVVHRLRR